MVLKTVFYVKMFIIEMQMEMYDFCLWIHNTETYKENVPESGE